MLILAHRGASKYAPENTRHAFELGFAMHADGIEFDVHLIEHEIIVLHDFYLQRTTDKSGYIFDLPLTQISQAKAHDGKNLLTLAQVLAIAPADKWCNIEIKSAYNIEQWLVSFETAMVRANTTPEKIVISSFDHHVLKAIKQRKPELKIGALSACNPLNGALFASELHAYSAHFDINTVNPSLIDDAHQRGLKVFVYTVDHPTDMLRLREWKVDGIFTNVPDVARATLAKNVLLPKPIT